MYARNTVLALYPEAIVVFEDDDTLVYEHDGPDARVIGSVPGHDVERVWSDMAWDIQESWDIGRHEDEEDEEE